MADDFRPEAGCYGSPALTPNLDRLAQRSLLFSNAYCQQAVCNPSRSSLLTGRRPDSLRIWNNSVHFRERNPDIQTLPLWFKTHGYHTRCIGKIFHNWHTKIQGDPQSWSVPEFLHYANHGDDRALVDGPLPPNFARTTSGFGYSGPGICECRDVPDAAYYDGRVADEAVRVLRSLPAQPFFLAVGFWKPHAHFNAPKKYWDLYDRSRLPELLNARPLNAPAIAFHQSTEVLGPAAVQKTPNPAQVAEMRHGYFANISYLDAQLGKVLDALADSPAASSTIIVFLSDHGYHIGEHSLWGKTSNFEYDARVPLMIHVPGMPQSNRRTHAITELIDLFPTLNDLCSLPQPPALEGQSLTSILAQPDATGKTAAFTQHPRPAYYDRTPTGKPDSIGYSIRTPLARYTEWRDWSTGTITDRELYLASDQPAETQNAVDNPAHAQLLNTLAELLHQTHPPAAHDSN
jgi:iduronate 2-sulfatase